MAKPRYPWDETASAGQNARRVLPGLVKAYFEEGRALLNSKPTPRLLHRLRLATKRLRYTLEVFRPWYGPGLDTRLASLRKIQAQLGDINDCVATERLLDGYLPPRSPVRARLASFLRARTIQKTAQFNAFWRDHLDRPGELERWTDYMARRTRRRAGATSQPASGTPPPAA